MLQLLKEDILAETNFIAENVATGSYCNDVWILVEDSERHWTVVLSWNTSTNVKLSHETKSNEDAGGETRWQVSTGPAVSDEVTARHHDKWTMGNRDTRERTVRETGLDWEDMSMTWSDKALSM